MKKQQTNVKLIFAIMKFSVFQTCLALLFSGLAIASPEKSSGQTLLDEVISIKVENRKIKSILSEIERSVKIKFTYNPQAIPVNEKISLTMENIKLSEILDRIFIPMQVQYEVSGGYIILSKPSTTSMTEENEPVPVISVTGKITDENGEPLPGVNVLVKGTTTGTVTNGEGQYSLEVPTGESVLVFSSIGYTSQEINVGSQSVINVTMVVDITSLEEVVVVGYNTIKKSDVTGSVVSIGQQELRSRPIVNALEAMQGKAAGVDITSNERPGEIGTIRIRGERSLQTQAQVDSGEPSRNEPLYVVDGIPIMSRSGIETLNPIDIESIDVLKDASATAIYGSRGANGVVLVTTKKGKNGKTTMSYAGSMTIESLQDRTEMMNAAEYIDWRRWAYYYADPVNNPRGDAPIESKDYTYFQGSRDPYAWANIEKGWAGGTWDGSKVENTDWTGMVKQTAISQTHTLSLSGGTDKVRAAGSFGYLTNEGTVIGQDFTRYSTNLSMIINPYKWVEVGITINSSYGIQQFGQSTTGGPGASSPPSVYLAARGIFPYAVPYDDNGVRIEFPGGDDLVKSVIDEWKYSENERKTLRTLGSFYTQLNILPGLKYRVNFGPDFRNHKNGVFLDAKSINRFGTNFASLQQQNDFSWTLDNLLYYDKTIDKHSIGATLLSSASSWTETGSSISAQNIPLPSMRWNALTAANIGTGTNLIGYDATFQERQLMSYMGRVSYGFNDKYLLTASGRWDGASQLADGHKWSFFPSAALAWRIEQEQFMTNVNWVNELKLRVGFGTTGNAAVKPYDTKGAIVPLFYPNGATSTPGYVPFESLVSGGNVPMANPLLGWERTTQYNLGFDFSLFGGRVSGVVDVYSSHTKDLLQTMTISPINGYYATLANVGETKNKGVDITLNTINVKTGGGLTWETSLNVAYVKDEIVALANGDDIVNNWFAGQSQRVIYGYASNGIWREEDAEEMQKFNDKNPNAFLAGKTRPVDQNGDYLINQNFDRVIIGNTIPRWTVGMTNSLKYKNFDFSIFLYGRLGYMFNTGGEFQGGRNMQRKIDYYTENNKDAEYQKPIFNIAGGDTYSGILGPRNASFIKVRSINLGYTLPRTLVSKIGMQNLKVYVQAKNPGTLYSQIDWLDMDLGGSTWNRGLVFGLNADF